MGKEEDRPGVIRARPRPPLFLRPEDPPEIVPTGEGGGRPPNPNLPPHKPQNKRQKRSMYVGNDNDANAMLNSRMDVDDEGAEQ